MSSSMQVSRTPARRLSSADRCSASEKRSSGKSRGWAWCNFVVMGTHALTLLFCQRGWELFGAMRLNVLQVFDWFAFWSLASGVC